MTESFTPDLSVTEIQMLRTVLEVTPGLVRAWVFGSRAKGTARPASDIDIAVEGLKDNLQVEALRERLNDLPLPYAVDVEAKERIKNTALRDHISRCGILLIDRERGKVGEWRT